ncbi:MAG: tolB [Acidobacteria bacterium]|nr:tolB [Acidobacteriota bacterium]
MLRRMKRALIGSILFLFAVSAFARPITEKDIFKFQWIGDPRLSPDGSQVAFVRVTVDEKEDRYATSLWSVPIAGGEPRRLTNGPRDSAPRWSPDGKTLAFLRVGEKKGKPTESQVFLLSMSGGESHSLKSLTRSVESIAWSPDGKTIAFTATMRSSDLDEKKKGTEEPRESDVLIINQATYRENGSGFNDPSRASHVWTIAVPGSPVDETAKPKQLTSGDYDEGDVVWSADGSRLFFTTLRIAEPYYEPEKTELWSVPAAGGESSRLLTFEGPMSRLSPSPDGKWLAFSGYISNPVRSYNEPDLYVVGTAAGAQPRNLTASYDYDVLAGVSGDQHAPRGGGGARPIWSSDSRFVYASTVEEGKSNLNRFDATSGAMTPVTSGKHDVISYAVGAGKTVALISTPTRIGDLFAVDANGSLKQLTDLNGPLFHELTLTEPDEIRLTSFDGMKIETWVQKPADFDATKRYPLILNIHGGPHAAYGYTFDHEFQWMAAKGYVVVYPNPRGSSSYGQEFGNVIQYRYPGDDYKDLMASVDAVIAKGYIDPKKLGVTGGSGGGLLTNWTITQTDRFAAAVSQRDIADWSTFWYVADFQQYQPSWFRKAPWQDPQDYAARSPITHIENVHTPLMLILGEADWRTPPMAGGEMMFRALKYLHRPAVMVRFPGESHELSRSGKPWHRVERLQNIVNWFDKWLLGKPMPQYDKGLRQ